jgi:hypothetical protein
MLTYQLHQTLLKVSALCIFIAGLLVFASLQAQPVAIAGPDPYALQTLMRRIYLTANQNGALNSRLIYGPGGKVSLRSHTGSDIIFFRPAVRH